MSNCPNISSFVKSQLLSPVNATCKLNSAQFILLCSQTWQKFQLSPMAEVEKDSNFNHSPTDPPTRESLPFVEVTCKRSGKIRRFAFGTEAGFALNLINKKSEEDGDLGIPLASYVEAVKEGEVPVSFGPNSPLVDYGHGWKLQTVNDAGIANGVNVHTRRVPRADKVINDSNSFQNKAQPAISFFYIGKILLAFVLMIIFGAIFTLFLENLPQLILYINSSV